MNASTRGLAAIALLLLTVLAMAGFGLPHRIDDPCRDPVAQAEMARVRGTGEVESTTKKPSFPLLASVYGTLEGSGDDLVFRMIRSVRATQLTAQRLDGLKLPLTPTRAWSEEIEVGGETLNLRWAEQPYEDGMQVTASVLFLGNVVEPSLVRWLGRTAWQQLRSGTIPATLYRVDGMYTQRSRRDVRRDARDWLEEAIRHHRMTCGPP